MSKPSGSITTGYVDIATKDALDAVFYGGDGDEVVSPFYRSIVKGSWFTHLPAALPSSGSSDSPQFKFSKTPDFVIGLWIQSDLPALAVKTTSNLDKTWRIAYTWNLGHNLFPALNIQFNDLTSSAIDSVALDMLTQFRGDAAKWALYQAMIGNGAAQQTFGATLPATTVQLPVPFSFFRDSTDALPLCAATLNTVTFNATVQTDLTKLIRVQKNFATNVVSDPADWRDVKPSTVDFSAILTTALTVPVATAWAKYVIVSNDERRMHMQMVKDVVVEQYQKATGKREVVGEHSVSLQFNNPIKALMFGMTNSTSNDYNNWSNYTDSYKPAGGVDPVRTYTLNYDNQPRISNAPASFASRIEPFYHATRGPVEIGYHLLAYCLSLGDLGVIGSTNYSALQATLALTAAETSGEANEYRVEVRAISSVRGRFVSNTFGYPAATAQ